MNQECENCPAYREFEKRIIAIETGIRELHRNEEAIEKMRQSFDELSNQFRMMQSTLGEIRVALQGVFGQPGMLAEFQGFKEYMSEQVALAKDSASKITSLQRSVDSLEGDRKWTVKIILEKLIGWIVIAAGAYYIGSSK